MTKLEIRDHRLGDLHETLRRQVFEEEYPDLKQLDADAVRARVLARRPALTVGASQRVCFAHDPTKEEARKRNAAKAGASKPNRELSEAKDALRLIADMVLRGELDSRRAAVAIQAWNAVIRGVEVEHRSMKLA